MALLLSKSRLALKQDHLWKYCSDAQTFILENYIFDQSCNIWDGSSRKALRIWIPHRARNTSIINNINLHLKQKKIKIEDLFLIHYIIFSNYNPSVQKSNFYVGQLRSKNYFSRLESARFFVKKSDKLLLLST